jgi:hypothetical protein
MKFQSPLLLSSPSFLSPPLVVVVVVVVSWGSVDLQHYSASHTMDIPSKLFKIYKTILEMLTVCVLAAQKSDCSHTCNFSSISCVLCRLLVVVVALPVMAPLYKHHGRHASTTSFNIVSRPHVKSSLPSSHPKSS